MSLHTYNHIQTRRRVSAIRIASVRPGGMLEPVRLVLEGGLEYSLPMRASMGLADPRPTAGDYLVESGSPMIGTTVFEREQFEREFDPVEGAPPFPSVSTTIPDTLTRLAEDMEQYPQTASWAQRLRGLTVDRPMVPELRLCPSPEDIDAFKRAWATYLMAQGVPAVVLEATPVVAVDPVVEANRQLLLDRSRVGLDKYRVTLGASGLSHRQLLQHALEEALDFANYIQTVIRKIDAEAAP